LFRAMADQFVGDPNSYAVYRRQICDYIRDHRYNYEPFIEDDEPFEEYLVRMRRNATWGGHLEIQACSMLYQVNVVIHQLNQPRWEISYQDGRPTKTIHLSYHQGEHYSSVRMIGDNSRGTPQTINLNQRPPAKPSVSSSSKPQKTQESDITIPNEEELTIVDLTGCKDIEFIRQVLLENSGIIDAAVEFILMVGPDNIEFQREYMDKPYEQSNYQKSNSKPIEKKNNNEKNNNEKRIIIKQNKRKSKRIQKIPKIMKIQNLKKKFPEAEKENQSKIAK